MHRRLTFQGDAAAVTSLAGELVAVGLLMPNVQQAVALVGASIIAPGFEPVAKLAQGIVLREFKICGRALRSLVVGYAVLVAASFAVTFSLSLAYPGRPHAVL